MLNDHYASTLTLPDEIRAWLAHRTSAKDWQLLLKPNQKVVAQYTFTFWETWCDDPEEWGVRFYDHHDTVREGEAGEVIIPHPTAFCVWLIKFGKRRHWWIRWEPDRPSQSAEQWMIVPQFPEPPENDPAMYDGTLL